jgi:2-polyprenyl-3-methyl-5-hydroxy-6-metoxy-1,4-benzoquinol methylase
LLIEKTVDGLHAHLISILNDHGVSSGASILDVGCGTGAWLNRLKSIGWTQLNGIDYVMPEPVVGLTLNRFDINEDDCVKLEKFQVVTCIEVIEHIENIGRLLDLIKATLNPDGIALVTTPNIESLRARTRALVNGKTPSFDEKSDPTHLMPILRDTLVKMLARRQMRIMEIHQYPVNRNHSLQYRTSVRLLSKILGFVLSDELYGDNSIYLIAHAE